MLVVVLLAFYINVIILLKYAKTISVIIADISLMAIDGTVENLVQGINTLRVSFLKLLCLEEQYKEEAAKRDKKVITKDGKEIFCYEKIECFQNKN